MSLQSTYQSRKELLVENLETMGVTDYTADDGLTTLINAVLEIAPVPPTPTPASVTLTGTKSILSYADLEQSVLTATVLDANDDPVEGVSVDLYKDSVLWDTISTGVDGTISKTYSSVGVGDVSFTAEVGSLVSETFSLEDCSLYDTMTSNSGHWSIDNNLASRISYSSNGLSVSSSGNSGNMALITTYSNPISVELDVTARNGGYGNGSIPIFDVNNTHNDKNMIAVNSDNLVLVDINGNRTTQSVSNPLGHYKIEINNNNYVVYLENTLIGTVSTTNSVKGLNLFLGGAERTCTFKNVKIKPL